MRKNRNVKLDWFTKDMIDNFSQARKSYARGLAFYTYERQIPNNETKIQGLKNFMVSLQKRVSNSLKRINLQTLFIELNVKNY